RTTATPQRLSAVETVQGFTPTIPSGSTITSAVVRVRHYESGSSSGSSTGSSSGGVTLTVVATPGGGSAVTLPAASTCTASTAPWCDWTSADLGPSGSGILSTPAAISGLTVAYTATISGSNQTATENLDGIVL